VPRLKPDGEWVSGAEAARRIGITAQSVGTWSSRPGAPVKLERGKLLYEWPKFPRWREAQLLAERNAKPVDIAEAQKRKMSAEAEMAEMERDKMRGDLVAVGEFRETVRQIATTLRGQLVAVAGRYAPRTVGLKSLPESQQVWDGAVRDILAELQEG
jgi:phage terminase Nu1 subunit (DNA packaging protein)